MQGPLRGFHQDLYKSFWQGIVKDHDQDLHARTPKRIPQDHQKMTCCCWRGSTRSWYKNLPGASRKSLHRSTSNTWHLQDLHARTSYRGSYGISTRSSDKTCARQCKNLVARTTCARSCKDVHRGCQQDLHKIFSWGPVQIMQRLLTVQNHLSRMAHACHMKQWTWAKKWARRASKTTLRKGAQRDAHFVRACAVKSRRPDGALWSNSGPLTPTIRSSQWHTFWGTSLGLVLTPGWFHGGHHLNFIPGICWKSWIPWVFHPFFDPGEGSGFRILTILKLLVWFTVYHHVRASISILGIYPFFDAHICSIFISLNDL